MSEKVETAPLIKHHVDDGDVAIFTVEQGVELDYSQENEIGAEIAALLCKHSGKILIDASAAEFIDLTGLNALVRAPLQNNREVVVIPTAAFFRALARAKMLTPIVAPTIAEALNSLKN